MSPFRNAFKLERVGYQVDFQQKQPFDKKKRTYGWTSFKESHEVTA